MVMGSEASLDSIAKSLVRIGDILEKLDEKLIDEEVVAEVENVVEEPWILDGQEYLHDDGRVCKETYGMWVFTNILRNRNDLEDVLEVDCFCTRKHPFLTDELDRE